MRCTAQPSSPPPSPPSPPSPRSSPSPRSGPAPCVCDARDTARANTGICVCVIFLETVWPLTRHSLACGRSALRYVFLCVFDPAPPPPPISFPPYPVRLSVARVAPQLPVSLRRRPRCADKRRGIALFAPPEGCALSHDRTQQLVRVGVCVWWGRRVCGDGGRGGSGLAARAVGRCGRGGLTHHPHLTLCFIVLVCGRVCGALPLPVPAPPACMMS